MSILKRNPTIPLSDVVLVWLSAWALSIVGFNAFFLETATLRLPVSFALCGVLVAAQFAVRAGKQRRAAGIVGYLVLVAIVIAGSLALSTTGNPYADAEGNYLWFAVTVVASSTAALLLTRTLPGSVCWFIVCAFVSSLIEAFYRRGEVAFSIIAVLLSLALIVYRNFALGRAHAADAPHGSTAPALAVSFGSVALAVVAGLAAWTFIIAPLNPGVVKVTLITDYRQLPIVQLKGVANQQPTLDYSLTSNNLIGGDRYTTDDLYKGASSLVIDAKSVLDKIAAGGQAQSGQGNDSGTTGSINTDSTQQTYAAQSYTAQTPPALIALIVAALIAALIALVLFWKRWRRRHRLERMLALGPLQQMESIYLFLLSRLSRIGFAVPDGMTLEEFAQASRRRMAVMDAETRVPFAELARIYVACTCDHRAPTEDELVPFVAYYTAFWKAARRELGRARYLVKSFRL